MEKRLVTVAGTVLVLFGVMALIGNLALPVFRIQISLQMAGIAVCGVGLALGLLPFIAPKQRNMGVLFILAAPILTTGAILLYLSLSNLRGSWGALWPLEVLAVALGFVLAAVYCRVVWFGIPAILIGVNGLILAFCNATGEWGAWSVLWSMEPLAVGLVLLLISVRLRSWVLAIIGLAFCGFSWIAFEGMSMLAPFDGGLFRIAGSVFLIGMGVVVLRLSMSRGSEASQPATTDNRV